MFDISFTELLLIGVVALVVIGPERLPKVARTVGHLLGRAQRYVNDVKGDIQREVELEELRKMKQEMESAAHSIHSSIQQTGQSIRQEVEDPLTELQADFESTRNTLSSAPGQTATQAAAAVNTDRETLSRDATDTKSYVEPSTTGVTGPDAHVHAVADKKMPSDSSPVPPSPEHKA